MPTLPATALQQFTLANGLVVYLREDHRAPLVSAQLWYHVGSSQEPTGQSGLCHLVEHLMFEGSRKLAAGDYTRVMTQLGGDPNAFTTPDATCFPITLPASRLEVVLEIMADSMVHATLGEETFARELEVVKAERRSQVDNSPATLASERAHILANTHTPYATPTAGHLTDLQHLAITNVRKWYEDWYQPNNASLVVVGDVDMPTLRLLVERHFAAIPTAPLPERWAPAAHPRFMHRCQTIALPGLPQGAILAFNTPSVTTAANPVDAQALRLIPELLANGSSSRLYLRQVRGQQLLQRINGRYGYLQRGDCLLTLELYANTANATAKSATAAVMQAIEQLRHTAPSAEELERAKNRLLARLIFQRDAVADQAHVIGLHAVCGVAPTLIDEERKLIEAITAEDVRAAAHQYLTRERLTTTYLQGEKTPPAPASPPTPNALLSLQNLDQAQADLSPPTVHHWQTDEGAGVRFVESHQLPVVDLVLKFNAGSRLDGDNPGLAALTLFMLDEGTPSLDAEAFTRRIEQLGVQYHKNITRDHATVTLRSLTGDVLDKAVDLIIDMVAHPALRAAEFTTLKAQVLDSNKQRQASPVARARQAAFAHALAGHPYATPTRGTAEGIASIDTAAVRQFHQQAYSASNLAISLVGDLSLEAAKAICRRVCTALPQHWTATETPALPSFEATNITLEQPGAGCRMLMLLPMGAHPVDTDYPAMVLANAVLGGGPNSRLFTALRQEHGLSYGIRSAFTRAGHLLYIEWEVAAEFAQASLEVVSRVLERFIEQGPSQDELDLVRQASLGELRRNLATNSGLAELIATQAEQSLPADTLSTYGEQLLAVTPEAARVALSLRLDPLRKVVVSVGPVVDQQVLPAIDQ